jgi:cell division protein FtsB
MNFWVLVYRFAWILVIVLCVIAAICVFLPKCHSFQDLQQKKLTLAEGNARLDARVRQLEKDQDRFRTDPEFVERVARQQGMAKPGETIFKFADNTNEVRRP